MGERSRPLEALFLFSMAAATVWFQLRLAYLPIYYSTPICLALLLLFRSYLVVRWGMTVPWAFVWLMLLAVEVDAIGNLFGLYNLKFDWLQYDEFSHFLVPALITPCFYWILREGLRMGGYRLPVILLHLFTIATLFTVSGFYEIIELWDDKYMHPQPGMRIHGPYDTANDLQWDLLGLIVGATLSYLNERRKIKVIAESGVRG